MNLISPVIEQNAPEIEAYIRDVIDNDALIEAKELIQPDPPEEET